MEVESAEACNIDARRDADSLFSHREVLMRKRQDKSQMHSKHVQ